jgi:hypothetical protein
MSDSRIARIAAARFVVVVAVTFWLSALSQRQLVVDQRNVDAPFGLLPW